MRCRPFARRQQLGERARVQRGRAAKRRRSAQCGRRPGEPNAAVGYVVAVGEPQDQAGHARAAGHRQHLDRPCRSGPARSVRRAEPVHRDQRDRWLLRTMLPFMGRLMPGGSCGAARNLARGPPHRPPDRAPSTSAAGARRWRARPGSSQAASKRSGRTQQQQLDQQPRRCDRGGRRAAGDGATSAARPWAALAAHYDEKQLIELHDAHRRLRDGRHDDQHARGRDRMKLAGLLLIAMLALPAQAWAYGDGVKKNVPITMRDGTVLRADVHVPADRGRERRRPARSRSPQRGRLRQVGDPPDSSTSSRVEPGSSGAGTSRRSSTCAGPGRSGGASSCSQPRRRSDSRGGGSAGPRSCPAATGKVGMVGGSYLGIAQLFGGGAVGPGSPLKAIFPMIAANDPYRELSCPAASSTRSAIAATWASPAVTVTNPLPSGARPSAAIGPIAGSVGLARPPSSGRPLDTASASPAARAYDGRWRARGARRVLGAGRPQPHPGIPGRRPLRRVPGGRAIDFVGLQNAGGRTTIGRCGPARHRRTSCSSGRGTTRRRRGADGVSTDAARLVRPLAQGRDTASTRRPRRST